MSKSSKKLAELSLNYEALQRQDLTHDRCHVVIRKAVSPSTVPCNAHTAAEVLRSQVRDAKVRGATSGTEFASICL
jgi:hypothetical protein